MDAKIERMHNLFGVTPGKTCLLCSHRHTVQKGKHRFKCVVYGMANTGLTDWDWDYPACGLFNKPIPKEWQNKEVYMARKTRDHEGQISFF